MFTTTITTENWSSYLIVDAIKRNIERHWKDSLFMASRYEIDGVYFEEEIDNQADILISIYQGESEHYNWK